MTTCTRCGKNVDGIHTCTPMTTLIYELEQEILKLKSKYDEVNTLWENYDFEALPKLQATFAENERQHAITIAQRDEARRKLADLSQQDPVAWRHSRGENAGWWYYDKASCPQCEPLFVMPKPSEQPISSGVSRQNTGLIDAFKTLDRIDSKYIKTNDSRHMFDAVIDLEPFVDLLEADRKQVREECAQICEAEALKKGEFVDGCDDETAGVIQGMNKCAELSCKQSKCPSHFLWTPWRGITNKGKLEIT